MVSNSTAAWKTITLQPSGMDTPTTKFKEEHFRREILGLANYHLEVAAQIILEELNRRQAMRGAYDEPPF